MKPKKHKNLVHKKENNPDSKRHLRENLSQFNNQCRLVLSLLKRGFILTQKKAMIEYSIGDLHRRILDLKEAGYDISDKWVREGKITKYKLWYMTKHAAKEGGLRKPAKDISTQIEMFEE
jgi:hypothetical protein